MGSWKGPELDGLLVIFYQANLDYVKTSIYTWINDIFRNPNMIWQVNNTFLSLIPKVNKLENFTHFRPIGLYNVTYKLVTKILALRMKEVMPKLIGQNQSSLVPGRQISNNILIAQEVIHSMRSKKGRIGYMAIKLDLEKAYDKLNQQFIRETL